MPRLMLAVIALLALTNAAHAAALNERPNLTGRVTDANTAQPIEGATVMIYTARVRTGTSTFCPSCYADCGKRAATASDGTYRIEALDGSLIFRVLVVHGGHEPAFVSDVDPAARPIDVKLVPLAVDQMTPQRTIRGRVLDHEGNPVFGATVEPSGLFAPIQHDGMRPKFLLSKVDVDPLAVTNDAGEFVLSVGENALSVQRWRTAHPHITEEMIDRMVGDAEHLVIAARIEARGFARRIAHGLEHNGVMNEIVVEPGVTVIGRVLKNGSPLSGIEIGFVQTQRSPEIFLGDYTIGTRDNGTFEMPNIPANQDLVVYGRMERLRDHGAIAAREFYSGRDDSTLDLGDLIVQPAYSLRGRVLLADRDDDEPIPPDTRMLVSRSVAWDSQSIVLARDGSFIIPGLPGESISLSVRVPEYHVSLQNPSIDAVNPFRLVGRVDRDSDNFIILLEPGKPDPHHIAALREQAMQRDWNAVDPADLPLQSYSVSD